MLRQAPEGREHAIGLAFFVAHAAGLEQERRVMRMRLHAVGVQLLLDVFVAASSGRFVVAIEMHLARTALAYQLAQDLTARPMSDEEATAEARKGDTKSGEAVMQPPTARGAGLPRRQLLG